MNTCWSILIVHDRVGMKDTSGAIKTVIQDPLSMSCVEIEFRFITLEILFVYLSLVFLSIIYCICASSVCVCVFLIVLSFPLQLEKKCSMLFYLTVFRRFIFDDNINLIFIFLNFPFFSPFRILSPTTSAFLLALHSRFRLHTRDIRRVLIMLLDRWPLSWPFHEIPARSGTTYYVPGSSVLHGILRRSYPIEIVLMSWH